MQVVRASASRAVGSRFDFDSGQTNDFKIGVHLSCLTLLVVPLGKELGGIPLSWCVDRWPATPKRARYSASIAFLS